MTDTPVPTPSADTQEVSPNAPIGNAERHTHPISPLVAGLSGIPNAIFPMIAVFVSMQEEPWALSAALGIGAIILILTACGAYLSWRRLTYLVGNEDIRVDSGIISRAARSIPYERIQDVSLEQSLVPRLFDLAQVKFETGAGGGDDLTLRYLTLAEGERLRDVIRARKAGNEAGAEAGTSPAVAEEEATKGSADRKLFAMDTRRLFIFGLFEFSLAVFAVVAGLAQYAETFSSVSLWNEELWESWLEQGNGLLSGLGLGAQIVSIVAGLVAFLFVGSLTGLVRTFLRDWEFTLERGERGFRRRRGLLTKTDVVMPVHRVQAVKLSTGILRRRFGWYGLKFVSLAQDSGSASHDVAPFGRWRELEPIAREAGFALNPQADVDWQRGSRAYRIDMAIIEFACFAIVAAIVGIVLAATGIASPLFALLIVVSGSLFALRQMFLWRFDYNAVDARHFFVRAGWLAPKRDVASRVKLQSVEITRGPLAQRRGYATLKLGLAGGRLDFEGLPFIRAVELRDAILGSIAATDFSELNDPAD